jgi:hypothetical protein
VEAADPSRPEELPRIYAAWRRRALIGVIVASAVGSLTHGPVGEIRYVTDGEPPSAWLLLGLTVLVAAAFGPALVGTGLELAAIGSWRRLGRSSRYTRAAWIFWVLGPLPVLLLPVAHLFDLNARDALRTSATQVRYLVAGTAPALFALLPGILRSGLVLERFLPESRAPGQITLLAAPVCTVAYLLPLAALAQLAFQRGIYLGLLLIAASPLVPLLAVRRLLRRDPPGRAARLVRTIATIQGLLVAAGALLIVRWLGEHAQLRALLGHLSLTWMAGFAAKMLSSKWLTTVVVTDVLLAMMDQARDSARSLADTAEGESLARKLDALGRALRPGGPRGGRGTADG